MAAPAPPTANVDQTAHANDGVKSRGSIRRNLEQSISSSSSSCCIDQNIRRLIKDGGSGIFFNILLVYRIDL